MEDITQEQLMTAYLMGWAYGEGERARQSDESFAQDSQEDGWVTLQNSEGENYRVNLKDKAGEKESQGKVTVSEKGRDVTMTRKEAENNLAKYESDLDEALSDLKYNEAAERKVQNECDVLDAAFHFYGDYLDSLQNGSKLPPRKFYLENKERYQKISGEFSANLPQYDNDYNNANNKFNDIYSKLKKKQENLDYAHKHTAKSRTQVRKLKSSIKEYKKALTK